MTTHNNDCHRKRSRSSDHVASSSCYAGYTFDDNDDDATTPPYSLDRVDPSTTTPHDFFRDYVSRRKPCILTTTTTLLPMSLTLGQLQTVAGSVLVDVERRANFESSFGQNRTADQQVTMTVNELVELWAKEPSHRELYYLSTQTYNDNDGDDNDDTATGTRDPFHGPCRSLLDHGHLHDTLSIAGNLHLESCNLWMGMASQASSSGLHHDYHDNFYLLVSGTKTFRLYAPCEYAHMETYGCLDRLHANGLISYQSEPLRSDGVPLRLLVEEDDDDDDDDDEEDESDEDEEDVVLGKGFDYKSSDDDDDSFDKDGRDDFDVQFGGEALVPIDNDAKPTATDCESRRPDSFSAIDPTLPKRTLQRNHPEFGAAKECIVELQAGQALYLPASWFHCVTSSPAGDDELHMAINYWYFPPNQLDNFQQPYADSIWKNLVEEYADKERHNA